MWSPELHHAPARSGPSVQCIPPAQAVRSLQDNSWLMPAGQIGRPRYSTPLIVRRCGTWLGRTGRLVAEKGVLNLRLWLEKRMGRGPTREAWTREVTVPLRVGPAGRLYPVSLRLIFMGDRVGRDVARRFVYSRPTLVASVDCWGLRNIFAAYFSSFRRLPFSWFISSVQSCYKTLYFAYTRRTGRLRPAHLPGVVSLRVSFILLVHGYFV
jgi:hypothetical protein